MDKLLRYFVAAIMGYVFIRGDLILILPKCKNEKEMVKYLCWRVNYSKGTLQSFVKADYTRGVVI